MVTRSEMRLGQVVQGSESFRNTATIMFHQLEIIHKLDMSPYLGYQ